VRPKPVELECPTCQDLMGDLCELKSKYAGQVEELDGLKAKCGELQLELDKPTLSEELECESCPHLAVDIAELQRGQHFWVRVWSVLP